MKDENETIKINEVEYVRRDRVGEAAKNVDGLPYVIVRTYSAGVHAGYMKNHKGREVKLLNSRRMWSWQGAATLSQMAQSGTSNPSRCKFPEEVGEIILTEAIEILAVTEQANKTIGEVPIWKK